MTRRPRIPQSLADATTLATLLALAGCAIAAPQRFVLQDDTANWAASAGCVGNRGPPGCADVLTDEERRDLEEVLSSIVDRLPKTSLRTVRVRVLAPGVQGTSTRQTIMLAARHVRWAVPPGENVWLSAEALLSFAIAHEIGHILSPSCDKKCAHAADCEREADAEAHRLVGSPLILDKIASEAIEDHLRGPLERIERELEALKRGSNTNALQSTRRDASEDCTRIAELYSRYAYAEARGAMVRAGPSWSDRATTRDRLQMAATAAASGRRLVELCRLEAGELDARESGCLSERLAAVDVALQARAEAEIPPQRDPRMWPREVRWREDADVLFQMDVAPAWGSFPNHGGGRMGSRARLFVAWEGGEEEERGLRLGWARLGHGAAPFLSFGSSEDVSVFSAELVGRSVRPIGHGLAFVMDGGTGVVRTAYAAGAPTTGLGFSFDGRMAWAASRRVHLSAGLGYSLTMTAFGNDILAGLEHLVALSLAVDMHVGDYGARHAGR
jgi:hypothetical protein